MRTFVFEEGGARGKDGDATVVCGCSGYPLFVDPQRQPQIAVKKNGVHGVFCVYGADLIVTATWEADAPMPFAWTVTQVGGGIVANGYAASVDDLDGVVEFLQPAVKAALEKSMCQGCTHIHYQNVSE